METAVQNIWRATECQWLLYETATHCCATHLRSVWDLSHISKYRQKKIAGSKRVIITHFTAGLVSPGMYLGFTWLFSDMLPQGNSPPHILYGEVLWWEPPHEKLTKQIITPSIPWFPPPQKWGNQTLVGWAMIYLFLRSKGLVLRQLWTNNCTGGMETERTPFLNYMYTHFLIEKQLPVLLERDMNEKH